MSQLRVALRLDLEGNLVPGLSRAEAAVGRFASTSAKHLRGMGAAIRGAASQIEGMGNRWGALASGATVAVVAKQITGLEHRYTMLGVNAGMADDKIAGLKDQIYAAARASDVRVDPKQILAGIESIIEKTGDISFAADNIRNLGLVMRATGADGAAVGELFGEFQKQGITAADQVLEAVDILNNQGKAGAFTLNNLAGLGPRVVTAYAAVGRGGVGATREMGAALQTIRQGTGSSDMAATAFEALLRVLADNDKVQGTKSSPGITRDWGVQVWDPEAAKQGKEVMRPVTDIMREIVVATGGAKSELGQVFDAEAIRAFNAMTAEYSRTGGFGSLDKFMAVSGDGKTTTDDATRAAGTAASALEGLAAAAERANDALLAPVLKSAADVVNGVSAPALDKAIPAAEGAVLSGVAGGGLAMLAAQLGTGALATFSAGAATVLGGVVAPALAGYATGTVIHDRVMDPADAADSIGAAVAKVLAALGNEEAQAALDLAAHAQGVQASAAQAQAAAQQAGLDFAAHAQGLQASAAQAQAAAQQAASAGQESQSAAQQAAAAGQAAQAGAASAIAEAQAVTAQAEAAAAKAAAAAQAGIHGTITVRVTGPAQVTGVAGTGGVDIVAESYSGKTMEGGF